MSLSFEAHRQNRVGGHVAMCVARYSPSWGLPLVAHEKRPWMCVFHDEPGGPKPFVAFGGQQGMEAAVEHYLGPVRTN